MSITINKLPSRTWNKMKVNSADVDFGIDKEFNFHSVVPDGITYKNNTSVSDDNLITGMGDEFDSYIKGQALTIHRYEVGAGTSPNEALRLSFSYEELCNQASIIELHLEKDAELTLIMDYSAVRDLGSIAAVQTRLHLEENSKLRLVQLQLMNKDVSFFNDIGANVAADASFSMIQLILGDRESYQACKVSLIGENASFETDIAYLVHSENKLDMNYVASHFDKHTTSRMQVRGVLRDKAEKIFRGTIDIRKGAANAAGQENEEVLLIDDGVVNKSVPVILCGEEDVEGAHGATVGRLDEELLFYMKSRGFEEKAIYELMARARIEEVCNLIEDEASEALVHNFLGGI